MEDILLLDKQLKKARKKWVKLCNKHKARNLVEELYTKDAIYYNRGRVLRGHDLISQEYSYMNNPSYSLQLNPKHIEMVDGILSIVNDTEEKEEVESIF